MQKGIIMKSANGLVIALLVIVVLVLGAMGIVASSYIKYNNWGASMDAQLKAEWNNNQNILSAYTLKLKEAAKVPDKYQAALKDIVTATFQAQCGGVLALKSSDMTDEEMKNKVIYFMSIDKAKFRNPVRPG
jgi:predicted nucleic acid-binding protein